MSIFCTESILIGKDSQGHRIVKCKFLADAAIDLPAYNAYVSDTNELLSLGSEAKTVTDGAKYRLDSAGNWILTQPGQAAYTKSEVDALLATKENQLTFDAAPTSGSTNPVYSGGVFTGLAGKISMEDILSVGTNLSGSSSNHLDLLGTPDGQGGYTPGRATTPGIYNIGLTTIQNYCDNAPRNDAAAKLITMHLNSSNNVLLIFLPLVGNIPIYLRQIRYASHNFGIWYVLNPSQV